MIQGDKEYGTRIRKLQTLLDTSPDRFDHKSIDREIDSIIAVKKSFTNDLRLESNRVTREKYAKKELQHDQEVRELLAASGAIVQASSSAKVLSELIDRRRLYNNLEGKGNGELLSSAQGNDTYADNVACFYSQVSFYKTGIMV